MKIAYIAHPIGGDVPGNLKKIDSIIRCINLEEYDVVPFAPYYSDVAGAMMDSIPSERHRGMLNNEQHFRRKTFDVLRLYGDRISPGMADEITLAKHYGIPIVPMTEETTTAYYTLPAL